MRDVRYEFRENITIFLEKALSEWKQFGDSIMDDLS